MRTSSVICIIFILTTALLSCETAHHKNDNTKIIETVPVREDKKVFSVDLSRATDVGTIFIASPDLFSMAGKEFTVEAWIKRKTSGNLNGSIFSRFAGGGLSLYVKDNEPKFSIMLTVSGTSTFTAASGVSVNFDTWTHIAGVLVKEDHSAVAGHPKCPRGLRPKGTSGGEAETPHMDIYINGIPQACASTWDSANTKLKGPQFAPDDDINSEGLRQIFIGMFPFTGGSIDGLDNTAKFNGIIDEVRFWTVARTQAEIQQCMTKTLGYSAPCNIDSATLKGYWPLDEGTDTVATDISGNNNSGSVFSPFGIKWNGGWVTDSPF
ncbi:MAG: LamG domain-containing protein [Nitrospirae bacterium]|nr:LamG domain-containing protein [Nitrospirota bacterium]